MYAFILSLRRHYFLFDNVRVANIASAFSDAMKSYRSSSTQTLHLLLSSRWRPPRAAHASEAVPSNQIVDGRVCVGLKHEFRAAIDVGMSCSVDDNVRSSMHKVVEEAHNVINRMSQRETRRQIGCRESLAT